MQTDNLNSHSPQFALCSGWASSQSTVDAEPVFGLSPHRPRGLKERPSGGRTSDATSKASTLSYSASRPPQLIWNTEFANRSSLRLFKDSIRRAAASLARSYLCSQVQILAQDPLDHRPHPSTPLQVFSRFAPLANVILLTFLPFKLRRVLGCGLF